MDLFFVILGLAARNGAKTLAFCGYLVYRGLYDHHMMVYMECIGGFMQFQSVWTCIQSSLGDCIRTLQGVIGTICAVLREVQWLQHAYLAGYLVMLSLPPHHYCTLACISGIPLSLFCDIYSDCLIY